MTGSGRAELSGNADIPEREIQAAAGRLLSLHGNVALAWRQNAAAGYLVDAERMRGIIAACGGGRVFESRFGKARWMVFGTPGGADFIGLMRDGRMLALEIKRGGYAPSRVSDEQRTFLGVVNRHGGLGFVGSDVGRIDAILSGREDPEMSGHGYLV